MKTRDTESEDIIPYEELKELITKVPSWILRWGLAMFFGVLILTLALSALISYPDLM